MKFKHYFTATMLLTAFGAFTSCQDNLLESGKLDGNGLTTITLNVVTEDVLATRGADPTQAYISTGQKVNRLIYAVYKQKDNTEEYELQEYFATKADGTEADIQGSASPADEAGKAGKGQMVVDGFEAGKTTCIKLMLDPEATYKVVCWAQDKGCSDYVTDDLTQVKVKYNITDNTVAAAEATTTYYNNDESRDAFCGSSEPFKGDSKETIKVVLRRPFAQINVGTTGADYASIAETPGGGYYKYSKMEFTNLADEFNVLTNVASQSNDIKDKTVTFAWSVLPAWINVENFSVSTGPTAYSGTYGSNNAKTFSGSGWVWADKEEFLKVNLDDDVTKILGYLPEYPTLDENDQYLTETFKYMSMSYVLVPSAMISGTSTPDAETPEAYESEIKHGTTIGVKVYFNTQNSDQSTNASKAVFSLKNVPAARNWRTNILGGFSKSDNPGDDDDPSIFNPTYIHVVVATNYFGNSTTTDATWNGEDQDPSWKNEDNKYSPEDKDVKDDCQNQHNGSEGSPAASRSKK